MGRAAGYCSDPVRGLCFRIMSSRDWRERTCYAALWPRALTRRFLPHSIHQTSETFCIVSSLFDRQTGNGFQSASRFRLFSADLCCRTARNRGGMPPDAMFPNTKAPQWQDNQTCTISMTDLSILNHQEST